MGITLYHNDISPPSRAVWAVLKQIGIEFDLKNLDMLKQEHKAEWYLKINPAGQVPFLTDDDFKIPESRAIMCYLIDQYSDKSKHDCLYPADPKARAKVDSLQGGFLKMTFLGVKCKIWGSLGFSVISG